MAAWRHRTNREDREQAWGGWRTFLWIALLTGLLFLLGRSMVSHHFFSGGALDNHQGHSVGP